MVKEFALHASNMAPRAMTGVSLEHSQGQHPKNNQKKPQKTRIQSSEPPDHPITARSGLCVQSQDQDLSAAWCGPNIPPPPPNFKCTGGG